MPTLDVIDLNNKKVGSVELPDDVFDVEVSVPLLHQSVRHYLAGRRAGTHKTKVRSEVSGSGKKLWRQKGTGRARMGSIRSPIWRHGGTVHGPRPRSYAFKFNRKQQEGALRAALTAKLRDGAIKVVDELTLETHKTRDFAAALDRIEAGAKVLLVADGENRNLALASRNLPGVTLVSGETVHPYHLLDAETIVFARPTVESCSEALKPGGKRRDAGGAEQPDVAEAAAPAAEEASAAEPAAQKKATEKKAATKKKQAAEAEGEASE